MKAGISTACFYPMELEKAFLAVAERNIPVTEIFVNTDCELKSPYVDEMLAVQKKYKIKVCSVHPYTCGIEPMMLFTPYERRTNDMLEYMKLFFEYMNRFGADYFVLHGNKPENFCEDEVYFERFARMQDIAYSYGVKIAQENVCRCSGGKIDFLKKMSAALGEKACFVLDTKQAHRSGYNPVEFVKALGSKIVHVHYSDCGKAGDCLEFGRGEYDNFTLFNELKKCSYKGNIVIELYKGSFKNADELADNCNKLNLYIEKNNF